ncbi:hypothetical protein FE810_11040 [Thalassotalea litorea]|uniref:DUF1579 domain-containing protein n=1 Tax=Thalassotalea litorea TaxID=2020715 RepID=A0A5R9IRT3_9GAMM|nr:hypothetical protein [Thalassotalea litorea]TLU64618.1 hypothetical protein FE810_11040 [Thalassotalea litorea]
MNIKRHVICLWLLIGTLAFPAVAAANCNEAAYNQFDFWLGEWQVFNETKPLGSNVASQASNNSPSATSKITKILGNCSILEEYQTTSGFIGKSLNIFDKQKNAWHQTWVDNSGLLLQLDGKFENNVMVLQGVITNKDGAKVEQKISWQALENGDVRQIWEQRNSGGDWQILFNGRYVKTETVVSSGGQ